MAETTIFVTTIGDQANFRDCIEHLKAQTVERPVEVIDRVAPLSAAFQQMHERCRTPFYVQVDEDMILFPQAIEKLEHLLQEAQHRVAMVCAPLWDCDTQQAIYGVKIYRHAIMKQFPYENTLSCEVRQIEQMKAAGYFIQALPLGGDRSNCLGDHGKHYTPVSIFKRWQRIFQKREVLGNNMWIEPWARRLLERYTASGEALHLYALLGGIAGIVGAPPPDQEADFRDPNEALERILRYFPTE